VSKRREMTREPAFLLEIYLVDSDIPFVFERRSEAARDALVTSFFLADPPSPIVSALRTDAPSSADNPEIAIVRAYVGRWVCRRATD
jgi:hypothetical protein